MLNAGMYRGRIGDRAYFSGLGSVGLGSVYAGAGSYVRRQRVRTGATSLVQFRDLRDRSLPRGLPLAGMYMGTNPLNVRYIRLPNGRYVLRY